MNDHERRGIGRVVDEMVRYRDGNQTLLQPLNRCWGLYEAAELRDKADRDRFLEAYYFLNSADDANQPWVPPGLGSDDALEAALVTFEEYARASAMRVSTTMSSQVTLRHAERPRRRLLGALFSGM